MLKNIQNDMNNVLLVQKKKTKTTILLIGYV